MRGRIEPAPPVFRRRRLTLRDGRSVSMRAVRPEDAGEITQAFERLSARSRYQRFMQHKREIDAQALHEGTHPLAGRELALVATVAADDGYDIVGAARYVAARSRGTCEFAVTVADDWHNCGLGTLLLERLLRCAKRDGYRRIEGLVLGENTQMLAIARRLQFRIVRVPDDPTVRRVVRTLD